MVSDVQMKFFDSTCELGTFKKASTRENSMLPFIVGGGIIFGVVSAGIAVYKKYTSSEDKSASVQPLSIGRFAIWGQPNSGKTTFISRLMGKPIPAGKKEATTTRTNYSNVPVVHVDDCAYRILEIADMPGTKDRLDDWLELVRSHEHIFYLLNLSRTDSNYMAAVRRHLSSTVEALRASSKKVKRLNIIASHVDLSAWKDIDAAQVNNVLQSDDEFCKLYESIDGVAGYVYAANLTDEASFKRLIESIIKDVRARA
jgi:GTPase SAR1 family protein